MVKERYVNPALGTSEKYRTVILIPALALATAVIHSAGIIAHLALQAKDV